MTRVHCTPDCGNAPNKQLLKDFNTAFAKGDGDTVLAHLADDVSWTVVGDTKLAGRDAVSREVAQHAGNRAKRLRIDDIITHGKSAAAHGALTFADGKTVGFCDVYRLSAGRSPKIREIVSYRIAVDAEAT